MPASCFFGQEMLLLPAPSVLFLCCLSNNNAMEKRKTSLIKVVIAGTAVGLALGAYFAAQRRPDLRRRVADYLFARLNALGARMAERLTQRFPIHLEDLENEILPFVAEDGPAPALVEKAPLREEDVHVALTTGAERARQRLAERWAALKRS